MALHFRNYLNCAYPLLFSATDYSMKTKISKGERAEFHC